MVTADSKYDLILIKVKIKTLFSWQRLTRNMTLAGLISECSCTCRHARRVETVHYATSLVCFFVSSKDRTNSLVLSCVLGGFLMHSVISCAVRRGSRLTMLMTTIDASISLFQMERCQLECDAIARSGSHDLLTHVTAFRLIGVIKTVLVASPNKHPVNSS